MTKDFLFQAYGPLAFPGLPHYEFIQVADVICHLVHTYIISTISVHICRVKEQVERNELGKE